MAVRAILSAGETARLGNWAIRHVLVDTCLILREQDTISPSGAKTTNWVATTAADKRIPCTLLDSKPPGEQITATEQTGVILKDVLLPLNTDIKKNDRIEIGGFVYHVIDLYDPSTFSVVFSVMVKRLLAP